MGLFINIVVPASPLALQETSTDSPSLFCLAGSAHHRIGLIPAYEMQEMTVDAFILIAQETEHLKAAALARDEWLLCFRKFKIFDSFGALRLIFRMKPVIRNLKICITLLTKENVVT